MTLESPSIAAPGTEKSYVLWWYKCLHPACGWDGFKCIDHFKTTKEAHCDFLPLRRIVRCRVDEDPVEALVRKAGKLKDGLL